MPHVIRWFSLLLLAVTTLAATPEDEAKALFEQWNAAWKARDPDAMCRLLANDCIIIMTEPSAGAKRARFFTRESYLKLVRDRLAATSATNSKQTLHAVSAADSGDVFIIGESEERSRVDHRSEWFRYSFYAVTRPVGGKMLFRLVVAELTFYAPDVPPAPEEPARK